MKVITYGTTIFLYVAAAGTEVIIDILVSVRPIVITIRIITIRAGLHYSIAVNITVFTVELICGYDIMRRGVISILVSVDLFALGIKIYANFGAREITVLILFSIKDAFNYLNVTSAALMYRISVFVFFNKLPITVYIERSTIDEITNDTTILSYIAAAISEGSISVIIHVTGRAPGTDIITIGARLGYDISVITVFSFELICGFERVSGHLICSVESENFFTFCITINSAFGAKVITVFILFGLKISGKSEGRAGIALIYFISVFGSFNPVPRAIVIGVGSGINSLTSNAAPNLNKSAAKSNI